MCGGGLLTGSPAKYRGQRNSGETPPERRPQGKGLGGMRNTLKGLEQEKCSSELRELRWHRLGAAWERKWGDTQGPLHTGPWKVLGFLISAMPSY